MDFPSKECERAFLAIVTERMGDDLIVTDGLGDIPFYDYDLATSFVAMTIVRRGWARGRYRLRDICLRPGDLFVLTPGQAISYEARSDDYDGITLILSEKFARSIYQVGMSHVSMQFLERGPVHLTDDEFDFSIHAIETVRFVLRRNQPQKSRMVHHLVSTWMRIFRSFEVFQQAQRPKQTNDEILFERFYSLVDQHHKQSHDVAFYAAQLCITPKYLSRVVKQATGKTPLEWISERILLSARVLLLSGGVRSLQEVGERLGFVDYATFSKFFKKHMGQTPSQFRKR